MPQNKIATTGRKSQSKAAAGAKKAAALRAKKFDQYYTKASVAALCLHEVQAYINANVANWRFVEPSAGKGAFSLVLPADTIAIDIDPKHPSIQAADFLQVELPTDRPLAVIGNPPFGRNAKTAIAFFNHSAKYARMIAMIFPRTFCKASVQNRLDQSFHLVFEMNLPEKSFTFLGKDFSVPAVFQIWEYRPWLRAKIKMETRHSDFVFTSADQADFAIARIGAYAGTVHHDLGKSKSSHYFIKAVNKAVGVERIMRLLDLKGTAANTAGNPSLAKSEIVRLYKAYRGEIELAALPRSTIEVVRPTAADMVEPVSIELTSQLRRHRARFSPLLGANMRRFRSGRLRRWLPRRRAGGS